MSASLLHGCKGISTGLYGKLPSSAIGYGTGPEYPEGVLVGQKDELMPSQLGYIAAKMPGLKSTSIYFALRQTIDRCLYLAEFSINVRRRYSLDYVEPVIIRIGLPGAY